MIYITRVEQFSASHKLDNPNISEDRNKEIFGKCHEMHGHNYKLEVTVAGNPDTESGYVMDFKELKDIIGNEIIDKVDHQHLNDVEMFKGLILTAEFMVKIFWEILERKINRDNLKLYSVKLYETENNYVLYKGD